jgi:multidrug efflux pump
MLKEPGDRNKSQMQLAGEINKKMQDFKLAQTYVIQTPTIQGSGGGGSRLPVQFVLQAPSLSKLEDYIPKFMDAARNHPAFDIVDIDLKFNKPEVVIDINREKAFELGVSVRDIAQTIQTFFSEQRLGYFIKSGKQYDVLGQAKDNQRYTPNDIANIKIKAANGEMISLDNLVEIREHSLPPQLLRYNRYSSATISASTAEGYSLGDGLDAMNEIADEVLDETFLTDLTGTSADYVEGSSSLIWVFIFALVLVYLTLSAQFESFRDPLTVMLTVPMALAGALLTLWAFGHTLNIFSQIGMIVLVGIVTKNGILIVEFANQKRELGQSRMQAAINAANERVRPILMTSLATALGALPLAISYNNTANSRMSLGLAIMGGLIFSLALTLFLIPALYTFISNKTKSKLVTENE